MLELLLKPLRSVLGVTEHEIESLAPVEETEEEILKAVNAIHQATDSIERHVEVIEGLATSVGPLTDSVNQLTATMKEIAVLLAPMGAAERGIQHAGQHAGHLLGRRDHKS